MTNGERTPVDYAPGCAKYDGLCTCGHADCLSAGKHPRTKNGVKERRNSYLCQPLKR